jgi:hypothetical protein
LDRSGAPRDRIEASEFVDVQEIRTPGLLVANDIGNPIRHSVATIYIKHGCSQMENLENRLIISCPKRFRHYEIAKEGSDHANWRPLP